MLMRALTEAGDGDWAACSVASLQGRRYPPGPARHAPYSRALASPEDVGATVEDRRWMEDRALCVEDLCELRYEVRAAMKRDEGGRTREG